MEARASPPVRVSDSLFTLVILSLLTQPAPASHTHSQSKSDSPAAPKSSATPDPPTPHAGPLPIANAEAEHSGAAMRPDDEWNRGCNPWPPAQKAIPEA